MFTSILLIFSPFHFIVYLKTKASGKGVSMAFGRRPLATSRIFLFFFWSYYFPFNGHEHDAIMHGGGFLYFTLLDLSPCVSVRGVILDGLNLDFFMDFFMFGFFIYSLVWTLLLGCLFGLLSFLFPFFFLF